MSYIDEMLEFNKKFVDEKKYEVFPTLKYPAKKAVILTCMDTRLVELLPAALNLKNSDVKMIKNAGAIVAHPFGSVMRSLIIAIYELGVEEILIIGHLDCGVQGMSASRLISKMTERNIEKEKIDFISNCGIDIDKWLKGFDSVEDSVSKTVNLIKTHPLIPSDVQIHGFVIDPETGKLEKVTE